MGKYLLKRILFSIFSLIVVVFVVMGLIYKAIDSEVIFQEDKSKMMNNALEHYKVAKLQRYGYVEFVDYTDFVKDKFIAKYGTDFESEDCAAYINEAGEFDSELYDTVTTDYSKYKKVINTYTLDEEDSRYVSFFPKTMQELIDATDEKYRDYLIEFNDYYTSKGYTITFLPYKYLADSKGLYKKSNLAKGGETYLYAQKNNSIFSRMWKYMKDFISIETINDVEDSSLTDRYVKITWDELSNMPALVGSGTTHKYLIYFDNKFPYIHQNIIHLNLGKSSVISVDTEVTTYMNYNTGDPVKTLKEYPAQLGTGNYEETSLDFHTATYSTSPSEFYLEKFGDNYINCTSEISGLSRIANSFVTGIISTIIAYLLGLPLGILMARRKDKLADKIGMAYIIFIMAVPSLVYIFIFATIGTTLFGLPYKVANAEVKWLGYILPTVSLALPSVGSLMKWMRRYMIDQMNSDYVKFARSQGLSEGEIFSKHISKNAMIYLVHGIPGSILGCLTGAIITESVYGLEGIGRLLTNAITLHDNGVIVACTVFYTFLSIVSLILGDLLLAAYDPRISFTDGGGR